MPKKKLRLEDTLEVTLTKHAEFYRIAREGLRRATTLRRLHDRRQHKKELTDNDTEYLAKMNGLIELASIVAVVFSALALEAFINQYASEKLSKSYFDNYLDKADLTSKWIVIPRLILGQQIHTGSRGLNSLRWLVRKRNELVHYKSKVKTISQLDSHDWVEIEDAVKSCGAVPALVKELKKLDGNLDTEWLDFKYDVW